jgi:endonuclease/exonuclease/phosphatase family metal-dependent hydrolase
MEEWDLTVTNPFNTPIPYCHTSGTYSTIDLTLLSSTVPSIDVVATPQQHWATDSDHFPVLTTFYLQ